VDGINEVDVAFNVGIDFDLGYLGPNSCYQLIRKRASMSFSLTPRTPPKQT